MRKQAILRRFLFDLPYLIQAVRGEDKWLSRQDSERAALNILIYLREQKNEADPRAIEMFHESYCSLTECQRDRLWKDIHAKRGRPRRDSGHENAMARCDDSDFESVLAGLGNLTGRQLWGLSEIIASRQGRPPLSASNLGQQIENGVSAHQLIEKRRKARKGQDTRLRGDSPYESVMDDAQHLFGCSRRTLERAYSAFKLRRRADYRIVDGNGDYFEVQPLDDEYREIDSS